MLNSADAGGRLTTRAVLEMAFPAAAQGDAPVNVTALTIPQSGEPRWIVLGDSRRALTVLQSWRPWNLSSRLRWSGVLLAARTKMLHHVPGVQLEQARINNSYWHGELSGFPKDWSAVIHVGTPSFTRKAIVFFLDEDCKVRFAAKIPIEPEAAQAILNEASVLQRLSALPSLPRVLFKDEARGAAAQSWIEGKPVSRGFGDAHLELLSSLANPSCTVRVCDFRAEVTAELNGCDVPFDRTELSRGLDFLSFDRALPGFVEHRDFAPWNLKWLPNGKLGLLDWEWALAEGLPWQDACRFFFLDDAHFHGTGNVWGTMTANPLLKDYCRAFAIESDALPALTMFYLLRVLAMDWKSGNVRLAGHSFRQIQKLREACGNKSFKIRTETVVHRDAPRPGTSL